jgi:hypothetical protein
MSTTTVAATLERDTLEEIGVWVRQGQFSSGSRAIQTATSRRKRRRLTKEVVRLDRKQERALAEAGFSGDTPWPGY